MPPRLAGWILERALPPDVREDVAGDLNEMYARRRASGAVRARLWYWRQVASFSARFGVERLGARGDGVDMSTGFSSVDLRLALRMLVRYPGLTLVGVFGMAVGIAIATAGLGIGYAMMNPSLPLDEGDRIVALQNWDMSANDTEQRLAREFPRWRDEMQSVRQIGAFRFVTRNLIVPGSQPEPVTVAELSAAGFEVARVSPAMGRHLLPDDERPGAAPVVVIGDDHWRRRFHADPAIIGRDLQLGDTKYTVVGVMPAGFRFPVNNSLWVPLRIDAAAYEPRSGPSLYVFGRLAPGASLEAAQAELATIGQRTAAEFPATHQHLRARIVPYTYPFTEMDDPDNARELRLLQSIAVMLLVIVCVNVAILVYARTATRQGEIAIRTAIGASRRRIVTQLFVEALVLASAAALVGAGLVGIALSRLEVAMGQVVGGLPFWMQLSMSPRTVGYVVGLTILSAAIVGVMPALKATGRTVQTRLQSLSGGGGSRMQMGRVWTLLIVGQVGIAVALLPATIFHTWESMRFRMGDPGYATRDFLTSNVVLERGGEPQPEAVAQAFRARYANSLAELERRLEQEPVVVNATYSMAPPGEESAAVLEIDGVPGPERPADYNIVEGTRLGHLVRFNRVSADFFSAYDIPVLTGRALQAADVDPVAGSSSGLRGVVVNRAFVDRFFPDGAALGRRVRYAGRSREAGPGNVAIGRWYEIVGVVPNFPAHAQPNDGSGARLYHAIAPGDVRPARLSVRVRGGDPGEFAGRLRVLAAAVDPTLQLRDVATAEDVMRREQGLMRLLAAAFGAVTLTVVGLSAAGIYALMSFTVARRRKEIGIRTALGADPARILSGVFSRAATQLALGALVGMLGAVAVERVSGGEMLQGNGAIVLPLVALCMTAVGLLAALGPARRGLRIPPTEALREE